MYMLIFWLCALQQSDCKVYQATEHHVLIFPERSMADCEMEWKKSLTAPDPEGTKSYHICQAMMEPL